AILLLIPAEISAVLTCFSAPPFFDCSALFFGCSGCSWECTGVAGAKNNAIAAAMISLEIIYKLLRFYLRLFVITWMSPCFLTLKPGRHEGIFRLLVDKMYHRNALFPFQNSLSKPLLSED